MPSPPHDPSDPITATTLAHYNDHAESFWQGTRDHDVSQNIAALLRHLQGTPPQTILDLGCGPGRDLKTFTELGHTAIGLDGAPHFVAMAREHSGCEVWQQNLLALDLPAARFDGVFANAVLFHVPSANLPSVLRALHATLKPGGVLFSSNPRGQGQEGWQGDRYGVYHDLASWQRARVAVPIGAGGAPALERRASHGPPRTECHRTRASTAGRFASARAGA